MAQHRDRGLECRCARARPRSGDLAGRPTTVGAGQVLPGAAHARAARAPNAARSPHTTRLTPSSEKTKRGVVRENERL